MLCFHYVELCAKRFFATYIFIAAVERAIIILVAIFHSVTQSIALDISDGTSVWNSIRMNIISIIIAVQIHHIQAVEPVAFFGLQKPGAGGGYLYGISPLTN